MAYYLIYSEFIENCMFEWNVISKWLEILQVVWYILYIHSNNCNYICIWIICNLHNVSDLDVWIIWHVEIIIMPRKKPKIQTNEDRERDLAIKRDEMKLVCE